MDTAALSDSAQQNYLEPLLSHLEWAVANPRVLMLGSSAVNEAYRYMETYGFSRLQIDYLELGQAVATGTPLPNSAVSSRFSWEMVDVAHFVPHQPYHLIWASDLFDQLDATVGKRLLQHLLNAVAPGGEIVIGSNAGAYRLRSLAAAGGVSAAAMTLRRGPDGIKIYLHMKQPYTSVTHWAAWTALTPRFN